MLFPSLVNNEYFSLSTSVFNKAWWSAQNQATSTYSISAAIIRTAEPSSKNLNLTNKQITNHNYSVSEELKEKAANLAKINVLRNFYAVGILEQFVDTLKTFEIILPNYYSGVLDIWNSSSKWSFHNLGA